MTEAQCPSVPASDADRINRRFAGVGAALGLLLWVNLFGFPLGLASSVLRKTSPRLALFLGFLAMLSVLPGMVWRAKAVWGTGWRRAFPLARVSPGLLVWTVLCILSFVSVQFVMLSALDRFKGLPHLPNPFITIGVLGVLVGAPLAEEVVFRGYGLARIRELAGERRALLFTALMFALAHGSWVKFPGTFLMGCFLGWLVLRTGSLWPALLGHFANNAVAFVMTRLEASSPLDAGGMPWHHILTVGAIGLLCLVLLWSPRVRGRISGLNAST